MSQIWLGLALLSVIVIQNGLMCGYVIYLSENVNKYNFPQKNLKLGYIHTRINGIFADPILRQARCGAEWRSRACGVAGTSGSRVPPLCCARWFTWTPNTLACAPWSSTSASPSPTSTAPTPSILSPRRPPSASACLPSLRTPTVRPAGGAYPTFQLLDRTSPC